ncbi:MAG: hypothetical protein IJ301_04295 [Clostridia bacterium]|nr:hypothetical protein [Clostridia bacterium]
MTNEVNYAPKKYGCNGSTVKFSFNWKIIEPEDLVVLLEDELTLEQVKLVDGVDYTLEFGDVGGEITTLQKYPAGKDIIIAREVSRFQDKTYSTSSGFQTKQIEESLDRLSANVQDLAYTLDRALKVPIGSGKLNVEFPEKLINNNTLVWSDEKDAFVNYDVIGEMDSFEQEIETDVDAFKNLVNQTLQENKENTDADIVDFKQSVNSEISNFKQTVNTQIETFEQEVEVDVDSFKNTTNQTLQQNKENTDADIVDFKQSVNSEISNFKQEQQNAYDEFTAGVDEKVEKVADAAEKIDELEESVIVAVKAAEDATNAAEQLNGALDSFAKNDEVVHLANAETISGAKTFTQPLKIQNGIGVGSLLIGADVNASTLNNGARKLARIAVPTQENNNLNSILLGFDSNGDTDLNITNKSFDNIVFGGSKKIINATSAMSISFCVATERNATEEDKKRYTLEMDAYEARFNVQPNFNGDNLVTEAKLAKKQDTLIAGENITIEENIISAKSSSIPIGTIIPVNASSSYVPDGCLPCDGTEYTQTQFSDLWNNFLTSSKTLYSAYGTSVLPLNADVNSDGIYSYSSSPLRVLPPMDNNGKLYGKMTFKFTVSDATTLQTVLLVYYDAGISKLIKIENGSVWVGSAFGLNSSIGDIIAVELTNSSSTSGLYSVKLINETKGLNNSVDLFNTPIKELYLGYHENITDYSPFSGTVDLKQCYYSTQSLLNTCSYTDYEADIATYGQCGKFGIDTDTGTFRVPLIKDGAVIQQALTDDELGKSYNAGLPNITGSFEPLSRNDDYPVSGAFSAQTGGHSQQDASTSGAIFTFDASLSNPIYGNSDTVQMNAVALRFFVVVANGQTNQSMMDWSAWASGLQNKVNSDLSNCSKPYVLEVSDKSLLPSWYRVWSNGWCEQGGKSAVATATTTITLLKEFVNTDYIIKMTGSAGYPFISSRATSSFVADTSSASTVDWEVKGYIN